MNRTPRPLIALTASSLLAAALSAGSLQTPAELRADARAGEPYKHGIKAKSTQKKRRKLQKGRTRP